MLLSWETNAEKRRILPERLCLQDKIENVEKKFFRKIRTMDLPGSELMQRLTDHWARLAWLFCILNTFCNTLILSVSKWRMLKAPPLINQTYISQYYKTDPTEGRKICLKKIGKKGQKWYMPYKKGWQRGPWQRYMPDKCKIFFITE